MKEATKNKIKVFVIGIFLSIIFTFVELYLLGYEITFTRQTIGIITLVEAINTLILSKLNLIEDGKH